MRSCSNQLLVKFVQKSTALDVSEESLKVFASLFSQISAIDTHSFDR